ncbi:uncharacterized protein LOC106050835 isoform X2 [Biomphalaria glabrata]|uniref:Uncharacterized protein LOC106050835 isoform X2 n=1 Tax=Biomphalaria glabrata TaxID=6526 RepID=A0A9W3A9I6_BIOGL|nr:uncharacterized protein LOC106050835 isoform X2 [Biomphalaria glabrata]
MAMPSLDVVIALYSILLLAAAVYCSSDCSNLKILDGAIKINSTELCIAEFNSSECSSFIRSFNKLDLPTQFQNDEHAIEAPSFINLVGLVADYKINENLYKTPLVRVEWKPPKAEKSRYDLRGYLLLYETDYSKECRMFSFNSTSPRQMNKLLLSYDVHLPGLVSAHYTFSVYSLPPPDPTTKDEEGRRVQMSIATFRRFMLSSNPADWVPSISTKAYASGILDVKFTLSPPEFRFTKFKVQLLKKSHSEVNYYREETYEGKVQAKEEFGGLGGKCLCWKYNRNRFGPGCRQGRCCENACDGIMTAWIYVGSANSRTETVSTTTAFPTASYAINTTPATTSNQNVLAVAPSYTRDYDPAAGSRTNVSTLRSITNEARTMMMTESTFSITTNNMTAEIPRERGAVNTLTISSTSDPSKVKNNDASVTLKWLIASITVVALVTTIALILRLKRTNSITCLNTSSFALSKPALTLCVKEPLMPKYLNGPVLSPDPKESVLPPCPIESTLSPSTYEPVLSADQNESVLPTHQYESVLTPNLNDTVLSHSLYYDPIMSHQLNDQALAITLHDQDWVELKPNPAELSTKNLYIMSADDHCDHVTVVECLVDYLELHCHCRVAYSHRSKDIHNFDFPYSWFLNRVTNSDHIIFVNSLRAQKLLEALLELNLYKAGDKMLRPEDEQFLNCVKYIFTDGLSRDKVINIYFGNTHTQFKYLKSPFTFQIPNSLPEFLLKIHALTNKDKTLYNSRLPLLQENIRTLHKGLELVEAIKSSVLYERNNPGWLENIFGEVGTDTSNVQQTTNAAPTSPYFVDLRDFMFDNSSCETVSIATAGVSCHVVVDEDTSAALSVVPPSLIVPCSDLTSATSVNAALTQINENTRV